MKHAIWAPSFVLLLTLQAGAARSTPLVEAINLLTMLESTSSVLTTLGDYSKLNPDGITDGSTKLGPGGLVGTGTYSSSGWTYNGSGIFGGQALQMSYLGYLTGTDGSDITVNLTGTGTLGNQPLSMTGSAEWDFDAATNTYRTMSFSEQTKIGSNSWWGWVRGIEYYVGLEVGILGGIAAGIGTAVTGPGALVIGVASGAAVGIAATAGTITISNAIKSDLASTDTPPPALPPFPNAPYGPDTQVALVTAARLAADDMDNRYLTTGAYAGGTFGVTANNVPEPSTALLLGTSLLCLLSVRNQKNRT